MSNSGRQPAYYLYVLWPRQGPTPDASSYRAWPPHAGLECIEAVHGQANKELHGFWLGPKSKLQWRVIDGLGGHQFTTLCPSRSYSISVNLCLYYFFHIIRLKLRQLFRPKRCLGKAMNLENGRLLLLPF